MNRRSMTAYGRALHLSKWGRWTIDIHSVNRKGLDLNIQLPSNLLFLDPVIREWIREVADRGQVTVRIGFEFSHVEMSIAQLKGIQKRWIAVAKALGYDSQIVDFKFLMERVDPTEMGAEEEPLQRDLEKGWKLAVKNWLMMKDEEGKTLETDIRKRMEILTKELGKVEKQQPLLQEKYRKKIVQRLKDVQMDEERLVREVALLAEKADITEEVTRLYSHLDQMRQYLSSKEKSVGRTLDFLAQEMGREVGTLMAKAGDTSIAKSGVLMKSEVEKIREQVQHIE